MQADHTDQSAMFISSSSRTILLASSISFSITWRENVPAPIGNRVLEIALETTQSIPSSMSLWW
jgi:hypothetical protein